MNNNQLAKVLKDIVAKEAGGFSKSVLQTGHFMLNYRIQESASGKALVADDHNISLRQFSEETWEVGRDLVRLNHIERLLLLVNDWQELEPFRPGITDHMVFQKLKSDALEKYYAENPTLPYCLREAPVKEDSIERRSIDCWMFSESALRDEFRISVIKELEPRFEFIRKVREEGKSYVRFYRAETDLKEFHDNNEYNLLCENTTDCAGEVVQLLNNMKKRSVDCFVNFYPMSCRRYVNIGCLIAEAVLPKERKMKVVNVAIGDTLADSAIKVNIYTM